MKHKLPFINALMNGNTFRIEGKACDSEFEERERERERTAKDERDCYEEAREHSIYTAEVQKEREEKRL